MLFRNVELSSVVSPTEIKKSHNKLNAKSEMISSVLKNFWIKNSVSSKEFYLEVLS